MKTCRRFRAYPTPEQERALANTFGACRWVYNTMLRIRTDSYHEGVTIDYHKSSAMLTKMRRSKESGWLMEVSCVPTQQALRHLQTGFQRFFNKVSRYPSFKTKKSKQSAAYTQAGFRLRDGRLSLAKIGVIKVRWSRKIDVMPTTVAIAKLPSGRYYVTLVVDEEFDALPKTNQSVGIDMGLTSLAALSTGEKIANPRFQEKQLKKLARLQRSAARRIKGSNRRALMARRIARVHEKIRDSRLDYYNKATTDLVRRFDNIYAEDLNVAGMMRCRPRARSIGDTAISTFVNMLDYKSKRYGRNFVKVDQFFPSTKRCSECGHVMREMDLRFRVWTCPECGDTHDRDINAAKNILAVGHTVSVQEEHVRRKAALAAERGVRRTANSKEMPSTVHCVKKTRRK